MNNRLSTIIFFISTFALVGEVVGQSMVTIDDCGVTYIDPQDVITKTTPSHDTVIYQTFFTEPDQQRAYHVDINAFGGQQVDKVAVRAVLPDGSLKTMGTMAFGNCLDCVDGFALVYNDSLLVENVANRETIDRWLQSYNQPAFSLTSNLQTLRGVGRLSGLLPPCAQGINVEFVIYSDPASTTTEFAAQVVCPIIVRDCKPELATTIDCQKDSLFLSAIIPRDCYAADANIRWWDENGFTSNTSNVSLPLSNRANVYYFTLEDEYCTFMDSVLIEIPAFAEAGPDQMVCQGDAVSLNASGGIQHFWENEMGEEIPGDQLDLPAVQSANSGRYILHAFNDAGCEDTDTVFLEVLTPAEPEIMVSDACLGESTQFTLLNDTAFMQIDWFTPQGVPMPEPLITDLQESDFGEYRVETIDMNGCQNTGYFQVSGGQLPDFIYTIEDHCDSTRVYLAPENYQYEWDDGTDGPILSTSTGGVFNLIITDSLGCRTTTTIDVPPPDGPDVILEVEHPHCPNEFGAIELMLADPEQPAIFSIDDGETYTLFNRFEELTPGDYTILVQDDLGCIQRIPAQILAPDTMGVYLELEELKVRPGTAIQLEAETIGNITRYQWLPKEIDSATPQTTFTAESNMDIRLIVEDDRGCILSDGFPLTIVLGDIYAPNAFSPDGDGTNDTFVLYSDNGSGEIIEFLRIFDRFGELLFEKENIPLNEETNGWDGEFRGRELNTGVYVYHAIVRFGNGVRKTYMGDVLLMR